MDRTRRQKISKNIEPLHSIINQIDIIDIHRALHKNTAPNTFFSSLDGIFAKIDDSLCHQISLNKFKSSQVITKCVL